MYCIRCVVLCCVVLCCNHEDLIRKRLICKFQVINVELVNSIATTACVLNPFLLVMEIRIVLTVLMRRIAYVWLTSLNARRLDDVFQSENDVMA